MSVPTQGWLAYTDGASRGNPGLAGAGIYMIAPDGTEHRLFRFLGTKTNNQAEYEAMIIALEALIEHKAQTATIRADSELMVKQMNGIYRVKNDNVIPLFKRATELRKNFTSLTFEHVRREFNKNADQLANVAIDESADGL